jgi:tryptophanyl-tRNA synthetase
LFAEDAEREAYFDRARAGGMGYGHAKKDLLERILDYFGEMRERREEFAQHPQRVEEILQEGARRARELQAPVLAAARDAAGLGA